MTEQAYVSLINPEGAQGSPTSFAVAGNEFLLWPTPDMDEAYTHVYYRSEPELVNDGDAPMLPDTYAPWLIAEAALRVPFRTNSSEKQLVLREEVNEWRKNAKEEARRNINAQPRRIRRTKQSIWSDV